MPYLRTIICGVDGEISHVYGLSTIAFSRLKMGLHLIWNRVDSDMVAIAMMSDQMPR